MNHKGYYFAIPFVAAIITDETGNVLVGQMPKGKKKPYEGYWGLPGGKIDAGETVLECLRREIFEETSFTLESYTLISAFHNFSNDPKTGNNFPGMGVCYEVTVSGDFSPTELENMEFRSLEDIKKLEFAPWFTHFINDYIDYKNLI